MLDVDGVLTVSWEPLPGAVHCLEWLRSEGVAFRLVTNTSSRSRQEMARLLEECGMPVDSSLIITAVTSAAEFLEDRYPDSACLVVNDGPLEDLGGVTRTEDPASAGVILLGGAGGELGYGTLNSVFRSMLEGTPVVALHRNTKFETTEGPVLDMGAFVVGLERASGLEIPVLGKPSATFFRSVLGNIGLDADRAVMVGDDVDSDVRGAQAVGITGVLVRTGKFRRHDLEGPGSDPDHVIDGIGDLPDLLTEIWPLGEISRSAQDVRFGGRSETGP